MSETSHIELPKSWTTTRLDQLGEWAGGGTPSKANEAFWNGGSIPWVSPKDMKSFEIHDTEDHITEKAVDSSATTILPTGTVLVVTRSGILRHTLPVAVTRVPVTLNQDLKALTPYSGLCPDYIAYALRAFSQQVLHLCVKGGTTVQSVEFPALKRFEIPIAPAKEQVRIVDTLNELLTDLDAGVASLAVVKKKLEHYRAAVLKAAVEGSLTAEWRRQHPDTEPASELLKRILAERRRRWEEEQLRRFTEAGKRPPKNWKEKYKQPSKPELSCTWNVPDTWIWTGFEELSDGSAHALKAGPFGSSLKKEYYAPTGYKIYGQEQVIKGDPYYGDYFIDEARFIQLRSCVVKSGDVLISLVGTTGKVLILPEDAEPGIINPRLLKVSLSPGNVLPSYIRIVLETPQAREFFKGQSHGGTMEILNLTILKRFPIPLPPLHEQQAIVEEVDDHISVIEHLEAEIAMRLKAAGALRQSILRHAFTGQLVPQDPNDEPTSELLKRIAAEREERGRAAAAEKRNASRQKQPRKRANAAS